ncbi:MAG TPA: hypothetical protein DCX89_01375 [Saprospirales bacterium]|nr:hypothetical protein [Saprospirales bacterium]HRQ30343.1 hypothetical protein [Saprospiraceae bacterium]
MNEIKMDANKAYIDQLLDAYWEGETDLDDEKLLKSYFLSDQVHDDHLAYKDLFVFFDEQAKITYPGKVVEMKPVDKKQPGFKWMWVAASFILLAGVGVTGYNLLNRQAPKEVDIWAKYEVQDTEEGLAYATEALNLASSHFQKGEQSIRESMKALDKIPIK